MVFCFKKFFRSTERKNCCSDLGKLLIFEAEVREFAMIEKSSWYLGFRNPQEELENMISDLESLNLAIFKDSNNFTPSQSFHEYYLNSDYFCLGPKFTMLFSN